MADLSALDGEAEVVSETEPIPTLVTEEGTFDCFYRFSLIEGIDNQQVQLIVIAAVDGRFVVAAPLTAWNRAQAKRLLRPQTLSKASIVELSSVKPDAREEELAQTMRVWIGYLNPVLNSEVEVQDLDTIPGADVSFSSGDAKNVIPYAGSLFAAANDHFAFYTAESEVAPQVGGDAGSLDLPARVGRLETTLEDVAMNVQSLLSTLTPEVPEPKRLSALRKKPKETAPKGLHVSYPSLEPSVAAAASSAGVGSATMDEMKKMLASAPVGKKYVEPRAKSKPKMSAAAVLSESEEEQEAEGCGVDQDGPPSLETAVSQLAGILKLMTEDKLKKSKAGKVEAALDAAGGSGGVEGVSIGSGKRAAAARRALRQALIDCPEEISSLVERLMMEDLLSRTVAPGMPHPQLCARAWVEHRSRIGAYKVSAFSSWAAAGILDDLMAGNHQGARARAALLLLQLDQAAIDKGSWTLAGELSLETAPPLASLSQHVGPAIHEGESPYSRLLDARWAEIALAHLRDTEDYLNKRRGLNKKQPGVEEEVKPKLKPKAKPRSGAESSQDA